LESPGEQFVFFAKCLSLIGSCQEELTHCGIEFRGALVQSRQPSKCRLGLPVANQIERPLGGDLELLLRFLDAFDVQARLGRQFVKQVAAHLAVGLVTSRSKRGQVKRVRPLQESIRRELLLVVERDDLVGDALFVHERVAVALHRVPLRHRHRDGADHGGHGRDEDEQSAEKQRSSQRPLWE